MTSKIGRPKGQGKYQHPRLSRDNRVVGLRSLGGATRWCYVCARLGRDPDHTWTQHLEMA